LRCASRIAPGVERRQLLEPTVVVGVQARLVVVDEHRGRDVHGVDQAEPLTNAARLERALDLAGQVDEAAPLGQVEPDLVAVALHLRDPGRGGDSTEPASNFRPPAAYLTIRKPGGASPR
jgi:hypothetical protein